MYLKINTELYCSKDEAELLFCWIDVTRWKYLLENMLEEVESSRHIYFSIIHKKSKNKAIYGQGIYNYQKLFLNHMVNQLNILQTCVNI